MSKDDWKKKLNQTLFDRGFDEGQQKQLENLTSAEIEKRAESKLVEGNRFSIWLLGGATTLVIVASAVFFLVTGSLNKDMLSDEMKMIAMSKMLHNYDLVRNLELLEKLSENTEWTQKQVTSKSRFLVKK